LLITTSGKFNIPLENSPFVQGNVGVSCIEKYFGTKHLNPRAHLAPFVYYSLWLHTILLQSALKTPQLKILIPSHCMQNKPFE
jgi:hypothetical protein